MLSVSSHGPHTGVRMAFLRLLKQHVLLIRTDRTGKPPSGLQKELSGGGNYPGAGGQER